MPGSVSLFHRHALLEYDYAILKYILHFFALCRGPKEEGQSWAFKKHTIKRKRKFRNQNFSTVKRKRKFRNQKFLRSKRKRKFRNQNFLRVKRKRKFRNQNYFSLKRKRKFRNQNF